MQLPLERLFQRNGNLFYAENSYVKRNTFIDEKPSYPEKPCFAEIRERLPLPVWDGHGDTVNCYSDSPAALLAALNDFIVNNKTPKFLVV